MLEAFVYCPGKHMEQIGVAMASVVLYFPAKHSEHAIEPVGAVRPAPHASQGDVRRTIEDAVSLVQVLHLCFPG
tara:strand:+ start:82 stop:303 length:222 start_codon:yes stop_codon:yes gene_type:complete